jgi:hypothetical protein
MAEALPNRLWHYTSIDAFVSIVRSKSLWASHFAYLNDASELSHILKPLHAHLRDAARSAGSTLEDTEALIAEIGGRLCPTMPTKASDEEHGLLTQTHPYIPTFLCAFSEARDQLSQWRAYAGRQGVAIGFDPSLFPAASSDWPFILLQCSYDDSGLQKKLPAVKHRLESRLHTWRSLTPKDQARVAWEIWMDLEMECARFKNPAFIEEREWRLVSRGINLWDRKTEWFVDPGVDAHTTTRGLVPHVSVNLSLAGSCLGIADVVVGPSVDAHLQRDAVRLFLQRHGLRETQVGISGIPFRP